MNPFNGILYLALILIIWDKLFETFRIALADVKKQSSNVSSRMEKLTAEMGNSYSALTSDIDRTGLVIGEVIARSPGVIASPIKLD